MVWRLGVLCVWFLLILSGVSFGKEINTQKFTDKWCSTYQGETRIEMVDGSFVDCVIKNQVIEIEKVSKWKEGLISVLHYARLSGKKPGLVLIKDGRDFERNLNDFKALLNFYLLRVDFWVVEEN